MRRSTIQHHTPMQSVERTFCMFFALYGAQVQNGHGGAKSFSADDFRLTDGPSPVGGGG